MQRRMRCVAGAARAVLVVGLAGACSSDEAVVGRSSAAIEVGPEVELEPPVPVLAAGSQYRLRPLRAEDHYLVAWADRREDWPADEPVGDLFAARITDDGTVLDPVGFRIAARGPALVQERVSGACGEGGVCLFVAAPSFQAGPIRGIRVEGDQVLDADPLVIADGGAGGDVAWDGERFRVVWSQGGETWSAAVTVDGVVGPPVVAGLGAPEGVIECGGARCLVSRRVVEAGNYRVVGRMLEPQGPVGAPFVITDPEGDPSSSDVFWDGARYWLSFVEYNSSQPNHLYLVRVSPDGEVLDPAGIDISPPALQTSVAGGSIGSDDSGIVVSWERNVSFPADFSVRVARVQADGTVLDPGGLAIGTRPMTAPGLSCGPVNCLAATTEGFDGDFSVRGYLLDGTALVDPVGFDVSTAPPGQAEPAATHHAGRYVAVWRDTRLAANSTRTHSIRGVMFPPTMDSIVPFGTSVLLGSVRSSGCPDQRDPKVAATSTSVMVTWHEECIPRHVDESYAQAFGLDGQPLTPALDIGNRNGRDARPSVVSNGSEFVVLWDYEEPTPPRSIQVRRYDASGAPLSERAQWKRNGRGAVAAFDGTNYLVVWQRPLSTQESRPDLFAARMAPDGTSLDAEIPIATLPNIPEDAHSVACGGGVCLVAWRHAAIQVRAVRLGLDGTVLDPTPLSIPVDGPVPFTSLTFDGEAFLLTWQEETGQLRAAQVTAEGEVVAPGAFSIAPASLGAVHPVVVSNGAGHRIALYDRWDDSPTTFMRRVRARMIGDVAPVPDAGVPDAGLPDAGLPDAAPPTGDPDYVVSALGDPPAAAVSGEPFSVGVTVQNLGGAAAASSTTRFFLSVDTTVGGDRTLSQSATVPPLAAGASDAQTMSLSVPTGLAVGSYFVLACADRGATVPESDNRNNCRASATTVAVTGPDLLVDAVVDPPASLEVGQSFSPGDTTRNQGSAGAASSAVAYYLSTVPARAAGPRRLSTTRPTGPLEPGAVSSGQVTQKVPSIAAGTYYLVACADVSSTVGELDEKNNCAASAGTTTIGPTVR